MTGVSYWFIRTKTTYEVAVPTQVIGSQERFNRDVSNAISELSSGYGVAGQLTLRASAVAIPGNVLCDGQAVERLSFPELFAAIGISWGPGNGTTTFNLPTQAGIWGFAAAPAVPPPQTVEGGTVSSGATVTQPSAPGETGGTTGGGIDSGGRPPRGIQDYR